MQPFLPDVPRVCLFDAAGARVVTEAIALRLASRAPTMTGSLELRWGSSSKHPLWIRATGCGEPTHGPTDGELDLAVAPQAMNAVTLLLLARRIVSPRPSVDVELLDATGARVMTDATRFSIAMDGRGEVDLVVMRRPANPTVVAAIDVSTDGSAGRTVLVFQAWFNGANAVTLDLRGVERADAG